MQATVKCHVGDIQLCCGGACGVLVPLLTNGIYADPTGDGKTLISFNLTTSPLCGIPIARVLLGNLEGLGRREELAELNPSVGSVRLLIKVGNHSLVSSSRKLTYVPSGPDIRKLRLMSAQE